MQLSFFKKLLKGQQYAPISIVTDKLRSYSAAKKELMPCVEHSTQPHENNRCELSHQPRRHSMKASHYRIFRDRAFVEWDRASCVQNLAEAVKSWLCSSEFGNLTVP
ncbi:transposase [Glaciecola sp. 33A]|uniref:transposase n=1 Tax=Glaciecola sp. 33A TaxID=2057807 RepID=UPI0021006BA5|nr:transposase [Glaciecola sp. 33A]